MGELRDVERMICVVWCNKFYLFRFFICTSEALKSYNLRPPAHHCWFVAKHFCSLHLLYHEKRNAMTFIWHYKSYISQVKTHSMKEATMKTLTYLGNTNNKWFFFAFHFSPYSKFVLLSIHIEQWRATQNYRMGFLLIGGRIQASTCTKWPLDIVQFK